MNNEKNEHVFYPILSFNAKLGRKDTKNLGTWKKRKTVK
jgi:hypothetical protein